MGFILDPKRLVKMMASLSGGEHRHHLYVASSFIGGGLFFWAIIPGEANLRAMEPQKHAMPTQQILHEYDESAAWSYRGTEAPENWGVLDKSYTTCGTGRNQSPVDIPQRQPVQVLPIQQNFSLAKFVFKDTGRTWELAPTSDNMVTMNGTPYRLSSVSFHSPSEHTVHGWNYPAEIQLIHTDANGNQMGIAVFVDRHKTVTHEAFEKVIAASTQNSAQAELSMSQFLPKNVQGWSYNGSQTTPPCKESIKWLVLKDTVSFSTAQLSLFRKNYPDNNRPVQPINMRAFDVWTQALTH